jgi:hypothetical protein
VATEASEADEAYRAIRETPAPSRPSARPSTVVPAPAPPVPASGTPAAPGSDPTSTRGQQIRAKLDERFPAHTGPLCSWCDYRQHCPEGRAAGTSRQPWDGLADLSEDRTIEAT